jgi:hypothetical protein
MLQILRDFQEHPESVGESYAEHWLAAMSFAAALAICAVTCAVHAFIPGLFKHRASACVARLHERMVIHRRRQG